MALIRGLLDLILIGSWIWLASGSLPQPLPALGAALFGAASAGYWAMNTVVRPSRAQEAEVPTQQEEMPARQEEVGRLTKFASRPNDDHPPAPREEWFNDPELGRRMRAEAERCEKLAIPMSVIFVRTRPSSLADWSNGSPPTNLADALPRLLDGSREKYLTGAKGREAVIALVGGDRLAAEELLRRLLRELDSLECEAGIVVHPDEGVDPPALASIARLRLQPLKESNPPLPSAEAGQPETHAKEEFPTIVPTILDEQTEHPETAVS
jgi:hypothetical protein